MAIDAIFVFCTVYHRNFSEGRGVDILCIHSTVSIVHMDELFSVIFTSLSHTDRFPSSISLPCRKTKMYFWNWTLFFLYQNVSRFKCAIKLYTDIDGNFISLGHLWSKWAVPGKWYKMSLAVLSQSETYISRYAC